MMVKDGCTPGEFGSRYPPHSAVMTTTFRAKQKPNQSYMFRGMPRRPWGSRSQNVSNLAAGFSMGSCHTTRSERYADRIPDLAHSHLPVFSHFPTSELAILGVIISLRPPIRNSNIVTIPIACIITSPNHRRLVTSPPDKCRVSLSDRGEAAQARLRCAGSWAGHRSGQGNKPSGWL